MVGDCMGACGGCKNLWVVKEISWVNMKTIKLKAI